MLLLTACVPPRVVGGTVVFTHDTTVVYDTVRKLVSVYDTSRTSIPIFDTTRTSVTVYDSTHVPVIVHDSSHVPVVLYDTTRRSVTLVDTLPIVHVTLPPDTLPRVIVTLPPDSIKSPTVVLPADTLHPRVILPVDTLFMRAGDPPFTLQVGDTIKLPVKVLPKCSCSVQIDTIEHMLVQGADVATAGVDTIGMHIYDWPTRQGELDVYLGTKFVGRLMQDNNNQWIVYRSIPGTITMPADTMHYPSKLEAMRALLPNS